MDFNVQTDPAFTNTGRAGSVKIELVHQVESSGRGWFNETYILASKNQHGFLLDCFLFSALRARFIGQFTSI